MERLPHSVLGKGPLLCWAWLVAVLSGCEFIEKISQPDPGPKPVTRDMLALMPESAGAAFAMPPVDVVGDKFFTVLERVAQDDVPAQDVATAFVHFLGHLLHAPEAESLGAIFEAKGVDPTAPIGFFLRESTPDAPAATAIVLTTNDPEKVRSFVETLGALTAGDEPLGDEPLGDLTAPKPTSDELVQELDNGSGVFLLVGDQVIFSNSTDFANEIADRMEHPMDVRYGTAECPAESATEFAGLIRMDRMSGLGTSLMQTFGGDSGLVDVFGAESDPGQPLFSSDPMVVTLDWTADDMRFSTRADLAEHNGLRRRLGRPQPLRLAKAAPSNTLGLVSLRFSDESKEAMVSTFGGLMDIGPEDGNFEFEVGESFAGLTEFVDDELTLAMTGTGDDGKPTGVGMLAVKNRTQLSQLVMSMPTPGEPVETYRRVEIRKLPGGGLYSATARNTLIMGNHLDEVKQTVDHLLDGGGEAFEAFEPAIDDNTARYGGVFLQGEAVESIAGALLDLGSGGIDWFGPMKGAVRDARVSADLEGTWLNGRVELRFKPEREAASEAQPE